MEGTFQYQHRAFPAGSLTAESTTTHNGSVCLCGSVCLMALWKMGPMKDGYETFN